MKAIYGGRSLNSHSKRTFEKGRDHWVVLKIHRVLDQILTLLPRMSLKNLELDHCFRLYHTEERLVELVPTIFFSENEEKRTTIELSLKLD